MTLAVDNSNDTYICLMNHKTLPVELSLLASIWTDEEMIALFMR